MDIEIYRSAIRNALKQIRLDSQLTQNQLAKKLDKPQSFISKYENGEREIEFLTVYLICQALQISLVHFQELLESYLLAS